MLIKRCQQLAARALSNTPNRHVSTTSQTFKSINKLLDYSKVPKVDEKDLEIQYVRGSGPGGQATNTTNNAVVMKHVPTNIVVKCHETRSTLQNKKIALEKLINKLDIHFNGEDAVENQKKEIVRKESEDKDRKRQKIALMKAAFKKREGLD